jgi:hypothetical protein
MNFMSYPNSSLCSENQLSKRRLAEQIRSALVLLQDALRQDGIAQTEFTREENEFFMDGEGI